MNLSWSNIEYLFARMRMELQNGGYGRVLRKSLSKAVTTALREFMPEPMFKRYILSRLEVKPATLHIETTNICNASCCFCAYRLMKRPKGIMDSSTFKKVVVDFVEIGGGNVDLTPLVGDPLVDPNLVERIKYLRTFPAINNISFFTNAIFLDRFDTKELLLSGVSEIVVSMGGADREEYKSLFGVDAFGRVCENVLNLSKVNRQLHSPVRLVMSYKPLRKLSDYLKDSLFMELFEGFEFGCSHEYHSWSGMINKSDLRSDMTFVEDSCIPKKGPCELFYSELAVTWNGDAVACWCSNAEGKLKLGNVRESSIIDIWQGERLSKLRESFSSGNIPSLCKRCGFYRSLDDFKNITWLKKAKQNYEAYLHSGYYNAGRIRRVKGLM